MRSLRVAPVLCTLRLGCLVALLGGSDFRVAGTASAAPPLAGDALEVKLECLEVLNDLLRRFAASLSEAESRDCLGALFGELPSSRAAARKRAIACIASLSASLPDRYAYQPRMRDVRAWISAVGQWLFRQCVCQMRFPYLDGISALGRQDPRRPAGWCYLWSNAYAWCQGRSAPHVCAARHPSVSIHANLARSRRFALVTRFRILCPFVCRHALRQVHPDSLRNLSLRRLPPGETTGQAHPHDLAAVRTTPRTKYLHHHFSSFLLHMLARRCMPPTDSGDPEMIESCLQV